MTVLWSYIISINWLFKCILVTEQGTHLNFEHQQFYLNCTAHGGGLNHSPTNLELLFDDLRKLLTHLTEEGRTDYSTCLGTE